MPCAVPMFSETTCLFLRLEDVGITIAFKQCTSSLQSILQVGPLPSAKPLYYCKHQFLSLLMSLFSSGLGPCSWHLLFQVCGRHLNMHQKRDV